MIYAEDMFLDPRREKALALLKVIPANRIVIPVQSAGETLNWLVKKGKVPKPLASERIANWLELYIAQATTYLSCQRRGNFSVITIFNCGIRSSSRLLLKHLLTF